MRSVWLVALVVALSGCSSSDSGDADPHAGHDMTDPESKEMSSVAAVEAASNATYDTVTRTGEMVVSIGLPDAAAVYGPYIMGWGVELPTFPADWTALIVEVEHKGSRHGEDLVFYIGDEGDPMAPFDALFEVPATATEPGRLVILPEEWTLTQPFAPIAAHADGTTPGQSVEHDYAVHFTFVAGGAPAEGWTALA